MTTKESNLEGLPVEKVAIDQIQDDPMNPNVMKKEQLQALEHSMEKEGNAVPIIINEVEKMELPYMVVNGHQRLKILRKKGVKRVFSIIIHRPLAEARAFGLGLNRNVGEDDPKKLADVFHFIFRQNKLKIVTGFVPHFTPDVLKLQLDKYHGTGLSSPLQDIVPDIPTSTKTQPGDMYLLGKHRIMCGDCMDVTDVNCLLGRAKINQLNTDPPYGVDYQGKNSFLHKVRPVSKRPQFEGEGKGVIKDYVEFYRNFLEPIPMAEYNTAYIFMAGMRLHELRLAFQDAGFTWGDYLVWEKNHFLMGRKDHKAKHENILYGWKGKHKFYGEYSTTTVYLENKPQVSEKHPTMKPVALVARLILEGTKKHDNVYEPFSGSGTCLIACEINDRVCYSMEKIPHYVDVAVQRWENNTGKKAEKIE